MDYALKPLRVPGLAKIAHADLVMLARFNQALTQAASGTARRHRLP